MRQTLSLGFGRILNLCIAFILANPNDSTPQLPNRMQVTFVKKTEYIVRDPRIAILVVYSTTILGLNFECDKGIVKVIDTNMGTYFLHLYPGDNVLTFKAKGFADLERQKFYIPTKNFVEIQIDPEIPILAQNQSSSKDFWIQLSNYKTILELLSLMLAIILSSFAIYKLYKKKSKRKLQLNEEQPK